VVLIKGRAEGLDLLRQGQVEGVASGPHGADRRGGLASAGGERVQAAAEEDFSIEQYALMLPRGDADFRLAVNRSLARL
jgi:ABC-type amino acid transport substrate-binding protein